jgi:hypothetical protein
LELDEIAIGDGGAVGRPQREKSVDEAFGEAHADRLS